jgi:hypothetical protein
LIAEGDKRECREVDTETGSMMSGGRGGSCVEVDCGPDVEVDEELRVGREYFSDKA